MKTVILKNGAEEAEALVNVGMMSLSQLMEQHPIAFYELVMIARDRNHEPFGNLDELLKERSHLQSDGRMHDSIRNLILSAVEGEGLDMKLVNPIK